MADFLDQDAIDRLQYELSALTSKKQLALDAKEKVKIMYFDIVKSPLGNNLESLEDIGVAVSKMETYIKQDSKYSNAFFMLKSSYLKRIYG